MAEFFDGLAQVIWVGTLSCCGGGIVMVLFFWGLGALMEWLDERREKSTKRSSNTAPAVAQIRRWWCVRTGRTVQSSWDAAITRAAITPSRYRNGTRWSRPAQTCCLDLRGRNDGQDKQPGI